MVCRSAHQVAVRYAVSQYFLFSSSQLLYILQFCDIHVINQPIYESVTSFAGTLQTCRCLNTNCQIYVHWFKGEKPINKIFKWLIKLIENGTCGIWTISFLRSVHSLILAMYFYFLHLWLWSYSRFRESVTEYGFWFTEASSEF